MTGTRAFGLILLVLLVAAVGIVLIVVGPQWYAADRVAGRPATATAEPVAIRKIHATLFYVSEDGERLVPIEREVPYGDGLLEQAKRIVEAEIGSAPSPLVSALPAATKLRALYVSGQGDAFVDFSTDLVTAHPGGSLNELDREPSRGARGADPGGRPRSGYAGRPRGPAPPAGEKRALGHRCRAQPVITANDQRR
jgi:hypothetical protein